MDNFYDWLNKISTNRTTFDDMIMHVIIFIITVGFLGGVGCFILWLFKKAGIRIKKNKKKCDVCNRKLPKWFLLIVREIDNGIYTNNKSVECAKCIGLVKSYPNIFNWIKWRFTIQNKIKSMCTIADKEQMKYIDDSKRNRAAIKRFFIKKKNKGYPND